jgi:hypothetical protein
MLVTLAQLRIAAWFVWVFNLKCCCWLRGNCIISSKGQLTGGVLIQSNDIYNYQASWNAYCYQCPPHFSVDRCSLSRGSSHYSLSLCRWRGCLLCSLSRSYSIGVHAYLKAVGEEKSYEIVLTSGCVVTLVFLSFDM